MSNFFTLQYPIYDSMAYNFQHKKSQFSFIRLPSFAAIPYICEIMILQWVFTFVSNYKIIMGFVSNLKLILKCERFHLFFSRLELEPIFSSEPIYESFVLINGRKALLVKMVSTCR
ncbi:hypothetical protein QL285_023938 [Trifolium repens]|nr:hypothetical protein QL285_023938 [Trifolium repens]